MPLIIATKIQTTVPDSIEYADDLQLGVRANGEQRTSFIDLACNLYNAEIPSAEANPPTFTGLVVAANGITPVGYYGYRYVFAATTRYPFVDGGKAIGGSIAPRGNPSKTLVVNMNVDLNYVTLSLSVCDRKDVTEIWVFRTTNYALASDAQLAVDAGLCFYVGKVANSPGSGTIPFTDKAPIPGLDQIEFDNFAAPTFKYVRYIPPYFWGIGNDQVVIPVTWAGNLVTISDSNFQWFDGRNGQLASIKGVVTGGVDGRGTFIFKAGDTAGFNQQINCILTKDGTTPETLVPASGTGYITIKGAGNVLYRSKPRNPFAWGETQVIGSAQDPEVYALSVATGDATAIIGLPEDEQLKVDFKNPSACYFLNLRLAGTNQFASSRKLISSYSVGAHNSQFVASVKSNSTNTTIQTIRKMLWGWDPDTFAILQCDGTSQVPISDPIFQTLRKAVRDPFRVRFSHGLCDDENELNCLWIPFNGSLNYQADYPGIPFYRQSPLTDLLIFQHSPTGKWGFSTEFDLTAAVKVRNLDINKIQILGGTETGLISLLNDNTTAYNYNLYGPFVPTNISFNTTPQTITFAAGTWTGIASSDLVGLWGTFYDWQNFRSYYFRISNLVNDTIYSDMMFGGDFSNGSVDIYSESPLNLTGNLGISLFVVGGIPKILEKVLEFSKPTQLKRIEELYIKGDTLSTLLAEILTGSNQSSPLSFAQTVQYSELIWKMNNIAVPLDNRITINLQERYQNINIKGLGIKLNN